jgi:AraC-like DNA-binding protein
MFFKIKYRYNSTFPRHNAADFLIHSPLHVRSCGHYRTAKGWRELSGSKDFLQMYWGVTGNGLFCTGGKEYLLKPNHIFFFMPGDTHDITALDEGFEYQWIAFDGNNLQNTIEQFKITREPRLAGKAPIEIFDEVRNNLCNFSQRGNYLASANGFMLLSQAFAGTFYQSSIFEKFLDHIRKHYSAPDLSLADIALALKVNRITLLRAVLKESGMSPKRYLDTLRLRESLSMLRETDLSIKEIAANSGFSSSNYFAKVVKKQTGKSPSFYRAGHL